MALLKVTVLVFTVLGGGAILVGWLGVSTKAQWLGCHFLHEDEVKLPACSMHNASVKMPEHRRLGLTDFWRRKHTKVMRFQNALTKAINFYRFTPFLNVAHID